MRSLLGERGVSRLLRRNHILFNWLNLDDPALLARHLATLGWLMVRPERNGNGTGWTEAVGQALLRLPEVLRERRRNTKTSRVTDREILFKEMPGKK